MERPENAGTLCSHLPVGFAARARLVMSSHVRDEGKTVADAMESVFEAAGDTGRGEGRLRAYVLCADFKRMPQRRIQIIRRVTRD